MINDRIEYRKIDGDFFAMTASVHRVHSSPMLAVMSRKFSIDVLSGRIDFDEILSSIILLL